MEYTINIKVGFSFLDTFILMLCARFAGVGLWGQPCAS